MPRKKTTQEEQKNALEPKAVGKAYSKIKPQKPSNFSLTTVLLLLVIIGLAGFLIYDKFLSSMEFDFLNQNQEESVVGDNYQVPLGIFSQSEQAQQQDPTVSWKMFDFTLTSSTEKDSLYSFKYPQELQVERNDDSIRLSSISTSSEIQLLVNFEDYDGTLLEWVAEQDKISAKAWEGKPSIEVVTSSDATFMEMPALVRQQKMLAADMVAYVLYFQKDGRIFSISMMAPQLTQEMINFYLIFINTFKF